MFGFIKNQLIYQLIDLIQMIYTNLINLHPNEYSQELHYYHFAVKLDNCVASCNTLNDLSKRICVTKQNKRFKYTHLQYDCRKKMNRKFNKRCMMST